VGAGGSVVRCSRQSGRRGSDISQASVAARHCRSGARALSPDESAVAKKRSATDSPTTAPHLKQKAASSGKAGSAQAVQGFGVRSDPS
jgi:hypothetical protein